MPRLLVPSPNEEALLLQQAQLKQKKERLVAARKQSAAWCKKRTNNHQLLCKEKEITQKVEAVKDKLSDLENKENELKTQLENAMCEVGKSYCDANELNAMQLELKKAENLAEYSKRAAERHSQALKRLNVLKEHKMLQETKSAKLKQQVRTQENERTKKLLLNPQQNTQPLIEIPNVKISKPLHGLDAFTKTYYHLPAGIGVVDESGMREEVDATTLAKEVEEMMEDCREKLAGSKQAREERAEVRGSAALEKVQLKNVLEDITKKLDKYSLYNRTKKKPSTLHTNIFASNCARINTQKQHQIDLEHAVEDIFDKHSDRVAMTLPSSVVFEAADQSFADQSFADQSIADQSIADQSLETIEEKSETESVAQTPGVNENHEIEAVENVEDESYDHTDEDLLADESRPSLNLYFPVQSDLSSERSPDKDENDTPDVNESTLSSVANLTQPSSLSDQAISEQDSSPEKSIDLSNNLDLSNEIEKQLIKNAEMKEAVQISSNQPPPISFTKHTPDTSSNLSQCTLSSATKSSKSMSSKSMSSSFEEIMQELLTSDQGSDVNHKSVDSSLSSKMSDSLSQHTLSQDSSTGYMVRRAPDYKGKQTYSNGSQDSRNSDYSANISAASSANRSSVSVASGLSELQKQLMKINSHLSEIEKIKDKDFKLMFSK